MLASKPVHALLSALAGLLPAGSSPAALLDDPPALEELAQPAAAPERPWSLTAFLGRADGKRFVDMIQLEGGDWLDSYIAGFALNRHMVTMWDHLDWEFEGSAFGHWGIEDHVEVNAAVLARWTDLPWDQLLDTSVAFGQGISWASKRPTLEDETRQFLHHLIGEVEVTPVRSSAVSLVLRIHHRSGVFGLYGASGGANFLTLGLRYRF